MKLKGELLLKSFVQSVSSPITYQKRYKKVCQLLDSGVKLTKEQWLYIWRGLYYTVWYTEMGKGCEQLSLRIGSHRDHLMIATGFESLAIEWFGIDAFRIDKFFHLTRIMINNAIGLQFSYLIDVCLTSDGNCGASDGRDSDDQQIPTLIPIESNEKTNESNINCENSDKQMIRNKSKANQIKHRKKNTNKRLSSNSQLVFAIEIKAKLIDSILTSVKSSIGLLLHVLDVYVDEMMKVLKELNVRQIDLKVSLICDMIFPFAKLLAVVDDSRLRTAIKEEIFDKLLKIVIIGESIELRKMVLKRVTDSLMTIGSDDRVSKRSRSAIYGIIRIYKTKWERLNVKHTNSVRKRKIVQTIGKRKRIRVEVTSASPFVRSIVPIAVL